MEEKTFLKAMKKVRGSVSRDELSNAVLSGLELTLRGPEHGQLLAELQTKAANITRNIPAGNAKTPTPEIRQAAIRCALLLEAAQKKAGPFTKPKAWPKILLISVAAGTALLYLILLATRYGEDAPVVQDTDDISVGGHRDRAHSHDNRQPTQK